MHDIFKNIWMFNILFHIITYNLGKGLEMPNYAKDNCC